MVEGWHRGVSQLVGAHHPTIYKFIDEIKKEQSLNEVEQEQYAAGQQPLIGKRECKDTVERENILADNGFRPTTGYCSQPKFVNFTTNIIVLKCYS